MGNKEIQQERIKGYFIEATKEILKGEGLTCVSVRNVADRAGYSYATLYNYFSDIKDLIFECVVDFKNECEEFIQEETKKTPSGKKKLKDISKAYIKYFIQYPGIFELFFLEKPSNYSGKKNTNHLTYVFYDEICEHEWKKMIDNNEITENETVQKKLNLKNSITGMLLFYNNKNQPKTYSEFVKMVDSQLDYILGIE